MPAKKANNELPKYVVAARKDGRVTAYKYVRRVPKHARFLFSKMGFDGLPEFWREYLSADIGLAMVRAAEWTKHYDEFSERIQTPQGAMAHNKALKADKIIESATASITPLDVKPIGLSWREWRTVLARFGVEAMGFNDTAKSDHLGSCLASAFGMRELIAEIRAPYPKALATLPTDEIIPPSDAAELVEFNAAKAVLLDQYNSLKPDRPALQGEGLLDRIDEYAAFADLKNGSKAGMVNKGKRFLRYLSLDPATHRGPSLETLDTATLRAYRDALDDDTNLNRTSVNAYMTTLRTLFKWAVNEGYAESDPTLAVQTLKDKRTVEDKQWKAFDDAEMKVVWKAVQEGWGPNGRTRLSEPRQAAFMMVFRVLLWTGMRPAEVFKLTPADVFFDRIEAKDTKTGPRTVAMAKAISDFPTFIASDTWATAMHDEKWGNGDVSNLQQTMSESFTKLIRDAGLKNPKHVLYSLKSSLVRQLNHLEAPDNVQRSIIGHKTPGKLRHYTSPADLRKQRKYLDRIKYCEGLG